MQEAPALPTSPVIVSIATIEKVSWAWDKMLSEAENNKRKYYQNNIKGTKNLILSCKNSNIKNFIFSDTLKLFIVNKLF